MKKILVLIAQAHGSDTPGKRSPDGKFREYKWSREITKIIVEKLYKLGIQSVILNPEEKEVPLKLQAQKANKLYNEYRNQYENIILISPHVNAAPKSEWSNATGFCCYVYDKASKNSRRLASIISQEAYNVYDLKGNRYIPQAGYFEANFCILRETVMPAILTESMFMTNKEDIAFLESDKGKEIISDLHVNSILKYINN